MKVTKTVKSPSKVLLLIEAEARDLEPIKAHVISHFARTAKVPGFRPGKAPLHLIEKNISQQALLDEFMEHALNDLYGKAIDNQKLRTAAAPEIKLKKFVPYTNLDFEAEVDIIGDIKLPNYKTMKLAKKPVQVTAKDINEVMDSLRQRASARKEVDRPAKNGDEVVIDFAGRDEKDQPVAGADAKEYPLVLGSKSFIPGFEDHLLGLKAGADKEFKITFPADYGVGALKSKKVTFAIKVHKVNEMVVPAADDNFAAKVGPFKTVVELKTDIKKQVTAERQAQVQRDYENELLKKIADKAAVPVPAQMAQEQVLRMEDEEKRNLAYRGQTWQEHLKEEGVTEEQHRQRNLPQAEERVKIGLILSEIAEREDIQVSEDEIEARIQQLKSQYQDDAMHSELNDPKNRRDITARLMTEKTIEKIVGYASK